MAEASGVPYVNLMQLTIPDEIAVLIPRETAETYMAVPFGLQQGRLAVDPNAGHSLPYFRKNHEPALAWLAQHLLPPTP